MTKTVSGPAADFTLFQKYFFSFSATEQHSVLMQPLSHQNCFLVLSIISHKKTSTAFYCPFIVYSRLN